MTRGNTALRTLTAALLVALLAGLAATGAFAQPAPEVPDRADDAAVRGLVESKLRQMTLEEKVGQLFVIHVYGETPTDPNYEQTNLDGNRGARKFAEAIEKYHPGGFIYFNWNGNVPQPLDAGQVNGLSNGLQEIAAREGAGVPLLISTDQEGGVVARVTEPATVFPGNMALGAARSPEHAEEAARIGGRELRALGINTGLAPVLDVNVNPENPVIGVRSYSEDPDLVSELGAAQVEGYQSEDIIATAKHFPGHGDTNVDSHSGLPVIDHDRETLERVDLAPFRAAVESDIDAIMTAHIVVPALDDSGRPATLSRPILTDLLRKEMGFDGVIMTDSLGMAGVRQQFGDDRVPVEAIKAGADVLLNPPKVEVAHDAVLEAVRSGEISEKRLDESVRRILTLKAERGLFEDPYADPAGMDVIGSPESLAAADEMSDESITLLKNEGGALPLASGTRVLVTGPAAANPMMLSDGLGGKGLDTEGYATSQSPTAAQIEAAKAKAADAEAVVVTSYTANTDAAQQRLVRAMMETGKPVIVAAMRNPYDVAAFPDVDAYVAAYGFRGVNVRALSRVLAGEAAPTGRLPVTVPDLYPYGSGLTYDAVAAG